jgi:branched-chain amino acid transport system substrate-binding protein
MRTGERIIHLCWCVMMGYHAPAIPVHRGESMKQRSHPFTKIFFVGAVILLLLSACVQNTSNNTSTTITGPVKIGISLTLTGDASADGQATQQGYQLWAAYVNSHGGLLGHQVQLIIYDDGSKTDQTRVNYEKLISVDHVNLVLGPFNDSFTVTGAEVAARHGYSFIDGSGTSHPDFTHGLTNLFTVSLSTSKYMASLVHYILSLPAAMRPKTVAFAGDDSPFTLEQVAAAKPPLEQGGLTTALYEIYPEENTDLNPIAQKVVNSQADVVILGTESVQDCAAYLKYFKTQHYNPKLIIATSGPDQGSAFTNAVGVQNAEGILVANGGWWPQIKTYQNDIFVPAFTAKFGGTPDAISSDSVQAFSVGQVLQQAVEQAQSLDNAKLISVLHTGTFQSLQGPVRFAPDGENDLAIAYLFQWQQGHLIPVYPQEQATANLEYPKPAWTS